jgi:hypothetical protein
MKNKVEGEEEEDKKKKVKEKKIEGERNKVSE